MKYFTYKVTGDGLFPFPMLTRDCCWPGFEHEANMLSELFQETVSIRLVGLLRPYEARWASFGWTVSELKESTRHDR